MKKLKIFLVLLLTILVVSGCGLFEAKNNLYKDVIKIKIEVKDYGTMEAELYPNIAPVTVRTPVITSFSKRKSAAKSA